MKILYIIRGVSGSGKTTLAHKLTDEVHSADDWFVNPEVPGEYNFNPNELRSAHSNCLEMVCDAMRRGIEAVAVANTFSQAWEAQQYFTAAREYGYSPFVVECQNSFDNVHGVPEQTIQNMLDRWEPLNNGGN